MKRFKRWFNDVDEDIKRGIFCISMVAIALPLLVCTTMFCVNPEMSLMHIVGRGVLWIVVFNVIIGMIGFAVCVDSNGFPWDEKYNQVSPESLNTK